MDDTISRHDLPTSFGTLKPVGHVMVGVPQAADVQALTDALRAAGFGDDALLSLQGSEAIAAFEALSEDAAGSAGFGYEITLVRRYLSLTHEGYGWVLVKAANADRAAKVAELAREHGATVAVHYKSLITEELI